MKSRTSASCLGSIAQSPRAHWVWSPNKLHVIKTHSLSGRWQVEHLHCSLGFLQALRIDFFHSRFPWPIGQDHVTCCAYLLQWAFSQDLCGVIYIIVGWIFCEIQPMEPNTGQWSFLLLQKAHGMACSKENRIMEFCTNWLELWRH